MGSVGKPADVEYYDRMLALGQEYEDFVAETLHNLGVVSLVNFKTAKKQLEMGENMQGWEIKLDRKRAKTHNLYIEFAEKAYSRPGPYYPSGICRENATHYVIGDYDIIYIFDVEVLRKLWQEKSPLGWRYRRVFTFPQERGCPTSQGFLLPESEAVKHAKQVVRIRGGTT